MRGRMAWAASAAAVLALTGCASGPTRPVVAGTVPSRPTTTVGGGGGTGAGAGATTTTPPAAAGRTDVAVYFVRGDRLESVSRSVDKVPRIGAEAVKTLLAGPTDAERRAGLASAIPAGTQLNGLTIDGGLARVDLSRTFEAGGSGLGLTLRVAQVACTLDAFPTVTGVRFAFDGQLVGVVSGDGAVVDAPVSCETYRAYVGDGDGAPPASGVFAGIWPFASAAEVAAYDAGKDQAYRDPVATARAFAATYVGMTDPAVFGFRSTATGAGEVPVGFRVGEGGAPVANPQPTTVVQVRQLGPQGPSGPWTVTGATAATIEVDGPGPSAPITSPVAVSGRAQAFEGTVNVEVREDGMTAGQSLGTGVVTGRGDALGPFQGRITFRSPTKPAGAVVFTERSAATGGTPVLRATVVRVALA